MDRRYPCKEEDNRQDAPQITYQGRVMVRGEEEGTLPTALVSLAIALHNSPGKHQPDGP